MAKCIDAGGRWQQQQYRWPVIGIPVHRVGVRGLGSSKVGLTGVAALAMLSDELHIDVVQVLPCCLVL
jgi:hypothetical protein